MMRLVQLKRDELRRVASVEEPRLHLLTEFATTYDFARAAIETSTSMTMLLRQHRSGETLDYDSIYRGNSDWKLLPPIDHPSEAGCCLISGTGLTHLGSAQSRQAMHGKDEQELTDSMRMFRWGLEKGRPPEGAIGIAPEWFYKGNGTILRASGEPLAVPAYAEDGGEEAEVAAVYLIGPKGEPYRIGMAAGNEFSDHRFEKRNYLNLAGSKLRNCSLGPELIIEAEFQSVHGNVQIERGGKAIWSSSILTGEAEMCHSLRNIEHHHFKFEAHRRPGDVHVHYLGAHALSFSHGIQLQDGDVIVIEFTGFGRPLRNSVRMEKPSNNLLIEVFRLI